MCCLISLSLTGQVLTQFSCSCQICLPPPRGERIPIQLVPLAARPAAPHMVLHLMSFSFLQACGIFQTILPWGPDVIPPSPYCKASLLEALLLHSATCMWRMVCGVLPQAVSVSDQ